MKFEKINSTEIAISDDNLLETIKIDVAYYNATKNIVNCGTVSLKNGKKVQLIIDLGKHEGLKRLVVEMLKEYTNEWESTPYAKIASAWSEIFRIEKLNQLNHANESVHVISTSTAKENLQNLKNAYPEIWVQFCNEMNIKN